MRYTNSNLNIKKNKSSKTIKINNFLKSPLNSYNYNSTMTIKISNNKNNLYNFLYKGDSNRTLYNNKNTISSYAGEKYSYNNKKLFNVQSYSNTMNNKNNRVKSGLINIKLNINNKIINNNFNKKNKVKQKIISIDIIEKIKEKDSYINKLQKNLSQSQQLLNKLQNEKQKNLTITYNSLKSLDNMNINNLSKEYQIIDYFSAREKNKKIFKNKFNKFGINKNKKKINYIYTKNNNSNSINSNNNKKLKALLNIDSFFNLNINNKNKRNNKNYNKNKSNYSLLGFKKNNKSINHKFENYFSSNNYYMRFLSSSPNRYIPHGKEKYESILSLSKSSLNNRLKEKKKIFQKSEKNNTNIKSIISKNSCKDNYFSTSKEDITNKCNYLKNKAYNILSNYISLIEHLA